MVGLGGFLTLIRKLYLWEKIRKMESIILRSESKESLSLLLKLAKKLGIEGAFLSEEAIENISLANAMKKGRTGELVDTNLFIKNLKKWIC